MQQGEANRLWFLFGQLRRRRFPLGPDDYGDLWRALHAGFGWTSRRALRDLCCALWAKSSREREVVGSLFDQLEWPNWRLPTLPVDAAGDAPPTGTEPDPDGDEEEPDKDLPEYEPVSLTTTARYTLPPISLDGVTLPKRSFVLTPLYPLTDREVAQAWRRLRRPVRAGPPTEFDLEGTLARWSRRGVAAGVVKVPRRRNTARILLLIDRQGSMAPFHGFVSEVRDAILHSGRLGDAAVGYFHDVPAEGSDPSLLDEVAHQLFPALDPILAKIPPLSGGDLFTDEDLLNPIALIEVLARHATGSSVVVISDAGVAKGRFDAPRLLDTIAFVKGLRAYAARFVWLNPLPRSSWTRSTCVQIARHVPMFPLDRGGLHHAVNVLRGQVYPVERPA